MSPDGRCGDRQWASALSSSPLHRCAGLAPACADRVGAGSPLPPSAFAGGGRHQSRQLLDGCHRGNQAKLVEIGIGAALISSAPANAGIIRWVLQLAHEAQRRILQPYASQATSCSLATGPRGHKSRQTPNNVELHLRRIRRRRISSLFAPRFSS